MPLGLDLKSVVVGVILAMFVWPWIAGMMAGRSTKTAT